MTHLTSNRRRKYGPSAACFFATALLGSCAAGGTQSRDREQAEAEDDSAASDEGDDTESSDGDPSIAKDRSPQDGGNEVDAGAASAPDAGSCAATAESAFAILSSRCAGCHGGNGKNQGNFGGVLSASAMVASGRVVPGRPESSPVYLRTQSGDMPRAGARLSSVELASIEGWIECGAPEPEVPIVGQDAAVDAGPADAGLGADAGRDEDDDDDDDRDEEAEEAQEDRDEEAEEAQEDRDEEAEEAREDQDDDAEEAADDDD